MVSGLYGTTPVPPSDIGDLYECPRDHIKLAGQVEQNIDDNGFVSLVHHVTCPKCLREWRLPGTDRAVRADYHV